MARRDIEYFYGQIDVLTPDLVSKVGMEGGFEFAVGRYAVGAYERRVRESFSASPSNHDFQCSNSGYTGGAEEKRGRLERLKAMVRGRKRVLRRSRRENDDERDEEGEKTALRPLLFGEISRSSLPSPSSPSPTGSSGEDTFKKGLLWYYGSCGCGISPSPFAPLSQESPSPSPSSCTCTSSAEKMGKASKMKNKIIRFGKRVLDAPDLADDFYLNLVDWGSSNVLGVGLGSCVYMWNSQTGRVNKLCELPDDTVTSVSWIQRGSHIAIGTGKGLVQIWDAERIRRLRTMTGHTARVGSLAWNDHILTSGSRDRLIYHRDVRAPDQWLRKLVGHKQEVCGLRWNCEDGQLASGGNDNKLMVWDKLSETPLWKFSDHTAAVKAIAWSPHQRGLLASGGGTADRRIIFHDTLRGTAINEIDTGSQVCNLAWSKNSNEIVSTHGYSQNQIVVWKYPSMTQVVSLTGHTYRVLYLAMSPDGRVVVTGAGDETLRFWNVFGRKPGQREEGDAGGGGKLGDWGVIR
ncbi:hypothetical protein G7Y89_g3095 [Cudoniella acicularis]|uniref:CDC20/Fizzy WD40 domain-containing protein n=1 Tax=Cudoniella acicularis TaxID=354080 RepID=A0A8H4RU44_9HELO|nr:hypothetical protein G7Y89_g3095 [Cudoniella acicularis]